jgi:transposase
VNPLQRVARASSNRVRAEATWRGVIRSAHADGYSLREIAKHAGVSHVRVLQIVQEEWSIVDSADPTI